jgi:hypothetical protein
MNRLVDSPRLNGPGPSPCTVMRKCGVLVIVWRGHLTRSKQTASQMTVGPYLSTCQTPRCARSLLGKSQPTSVTFLSVVSGRVLQ